MPDAVAIATCAEHPQLDDEGLFREEDMRPAQLIEPSLFLDYEPRSAQALARAVAARTGR